MTDIVRWAALYMNPSIGAIVRGFKPPLEDPEALFRNKRARGLSDTGPSTQ